jgi:hypothetical protein
MIRPINGNTTPAIRPFTEVEKHTLATHRYHVGFRADRNYFDANPRMNYAIRRALSELDWIANFSDYPPPPLYVVVYKDSDELHTLHGIFRGVPSWRQVYCHDFVYADLKTDGQALDLMLACASTGGMDQAALAQFETHNRYAAMMRALSTTTARSDGKVN